MHTILGNFATMSFLGKLVWYSLEVFGFLLGLLMILGIVSDLNAVPRLMFWNCNSWSVCLLHSLPVLLVAALCPLAVLSWVLRLSRTDKGNTGI